MKRFEDVSLDYYGDHKEKELIETCISNMLFDYRLNLENLCIAQFADLLQKTGRTAQTTRTKRMPVSQAMIALVGEKRKRPDGKVFEKPPMIPCTPEELTMSWTNGSGMESSGHSLCLDHQLRKKGRTLYFVGSIIMSSIPPRIAKPSEDSSTKS